MSHLIEDIAAKQDDFRRKRFPEVPIEHCGLVYRYFVIPAEDGPPDLPNFPDFGLRQNLS